MPIDAIHKKFPRHIEKIGALLNESRTFREICAEYEEMNAYVAKFCGPESQNTKQCNHARELLRDLEQEIAEQLTEFRTGKTGKPWEFKGRTKNLKFNKIGS